MGGATARQPGQTAGQSCHHYEGQRPNAVQGSGGAQENTSSVPDCIRFATWNTGTVTGKCAEIVETLHRQKLMYVVYKN